MKMIDVECRLCGKRSEALQRDNGHVALCECGGERQRLFIKDGAGRPNVIGDDIPGGMTFKHGICNEDGTPRTYYTKSEIRAASIAAGLVPAEDTGQQIPVHNEEIEQMLKKPGHGQVPRHPNVPPSLNPEDEAARIANWHAHEAELKKEPSWAEKEFFKELERK